MTVITGDATATPVASPAPPAPSAPGGLRRGVRLAAADRRWGYVFIGPQVVGMAVFVLLPFVAASCSPSPRGTASPSSRGSVRELHGADAGRTAAALDRQHPAHRDCHRADRPGLAVVIAVALEKLKTRTLYLILFFAPVVTSTVAVAMIWQQMFRVDGRAQRDDRERLRHRPPDWLGDPKLALLAVCIVSIWSALGLNVIIFLAGLQNISPSVIEAARIDGAGAWRLFRSIRMPLLSPIIFFSSIVAFISSLQTFDTVFVLTADAGPDNATRTIVYHIYDLGFGRFEFGPASAASVILLVLTLVITAVQFGAQKKFVHYEDDAA
jgi:multiple sugar transport system permease protein